MLMADFENCRVEWAVKDGLVCLRLGDSFHPVTDIDVIRAEFKGCRIINGITVNAKPSDHILSLRFHRFPCSLRLKVIVSSGSLKPRLELWGSDSGRNFQISNIPEDGQLIARESDWYSLIPEEIDEIRKTFRKIGIQSLGRITRRQAIDLFREIPSLISVETEPESMENPEDPDFCRGRALLSDLLYGGFQAKLYPYQEQGISWLCRSAEELNGCILADEMGLGKTVQIIAVLTYFKSIWNLPSLVVCPATLLENWRREFARFSPGMAVLIHAGHNRSGFPSRLSESDVTVCSYDTAVRDLSLLRMIEWGFVILDEAQAIKNPETDRAQYLKKLNRRISVAVTGTPVENRLSDLWSIMDFVCPDMLGKHNDFVQSYSNDLEGAKKLKTVVSPFILRRELAQVAKDLPQKVIISQPVNMTLMEIEEYERVRQDISSNRTKSAILKLFTRLRQYCTHPILLAPRYGIRETTECSKLSRLLEILEEIVLNGEKTIIFTGFNKMSDLLMKEVPERLAVPALQIDGRTPGEQRQRIVDQFTGLRGSAVLILNPRAAGTGLNITAANHVIHYTLEWNPAVEDQASARAFRRGQTLPVTVHRLYYPNTVDEVINDRLNRKRHLAETAVSATETEEDVFNAADIIRALQLSPCQSSGSKLCNDTGV